MSDVQTAAAESGHTTMQMSELAGKYLGFHLGDEIFGLPILAVQEIIGMMEITSVPKSPQTVRGVINLRGRILPVISLRSKFEMDTADDTDRTCIIVVQVDNGDHEITTGIIVDEVSEVMQIPADKIAPPPAIGNAEACDFLLGMGKFDKQVVVLLEVEKIVEGQDVAGIGDAVFS